MGMSAPALSGVAAVSELTPVVGVKRILSAWLAYWLDGTTKSIGGNANVAWPSLVYQEVATGQASSVAGQICFDDGRDVLETGIQVRVVLIPTTHKSWGDQTASKHLQEDEYTVQFWISANLRSGDPTWGSSTEAVNAVAEALTVILRSPDSIQQVKVLGVQPLIERSLGSVAIAVENEGATVRLLTCRLRVWYRVSSM